MSSDARMAASRANGTLSTGPGPATHQVTRANALRHGLAAESLMVLPHEDAEAYGALCAAVRENVAPGDPFEEQLALRIAGLLWRLARAGCLESGLHRRGDLIEEKLRASRPDPLYHVMLARLEAASAGRGIVTSVSDPEAEAECAARKARVEAALEAVPMAEAFVQDGHGTDAFGRLARYERTLQRSLDQTLLALDRRRALRTRAVAVEAGPD